MDSSSDLEESQDSGSPEAIEPPNPRSPVKVVWKTVKTTLKGKSSMPSEMRRWLSSSRTSEFNEVAQAVWKEAPRPEDEENSLFCESIIDLMQRSERFDYLGFVKEEKKDPEHNSGKSRIKRFPWTR